MAILSITEFADNPPRGIPLAEQFVEFGDQPAFSESLNSETKTIRIISDVPCAISLNGEPADPRKHRMAADAERDYQVHSAMKLSVVATSRVQAVGDLEALVAYSAAMQAATKVTDPAYLDARIAELRAATEAHDAARKGADEAAFAATVVQAQARDARAQVQAQREALQPQLDQVEAQKDAISRQWEAVNARSEQVSVAASALAERERRAAEREKATDTEVGNRISVMKTDYEAKLADIELQKRRLEDQAASLAFRERALLDAQRENAEAAQAMQAVASRIAGKAA